MTCGGNTSVSQYFPVEQVGGMTIWKGNALAFKIHPISRCISVVEMFNIKRYVNGTPGNLKIEVRSDSGGFPNGTPGSSTGKIGNTVTFPNSSVPLNYSTVAIDIPVELPIANIDYWIVIYSQDYICNQIYVADCDQFSNQSECENAGCVWQNGLCGGGVTNQRFELSYGIAGTNHNRAYYSPLAPCAWQYPGDTNDQVNFALYTNVYTCVNLACNIGIV